MEDWGSESGKPPIGGGGGGGGGGNKEIGDTVDIAELLFTPERDFLVKNNGHKVRVGDLIGKTIVLYFVPLYEHNRYGHYSYREAEHTLDLIEAYNQLLPLGGVEFVFVPVSPNHYGTGIVPISPEAIFNRLFSTMPFPAIPFSGIESCCDRLVKAFSVDDVTLVCGYLLPYWVVIDHTSTVVAGRISYPHLFKLFGGAELHPLSLQRIEALWDELDTDPFIGTRPEAQKRLVNKWDQLLASPTRDYLLSSNGDQVPISSLKDKVVGLYFCENIPHPPNMELIKKVYQEAKSRGYDFEIVQINFHFHIYNSHVHDVDMPVQQCNENISWLTLPFKDPSCRKLQRIFKCSYREEDDPDWGRDCLVIVDPRQADINCVPFEFSGVEIFKKYGIEGYPFTRQYLYEIEYVIQEKRVKLQSFFPPGLCHLIRPAGDGFDMTDGSQLTGKRVLVLFGDQQGCESSAFVSMLKSKYCKQPNDEAEENKFEVVYVSSHIWESDFTECITDMPWLVHPHSWDFKNRCIEKIMMNASNSNGIGAAAFGMDGELIAKQCYWDDHDTSYKLSFPFISQDWNERIRFEVESMCHLYRYYYEIQ